MNKELKAKIFKHLRLLAILIIYFTLAYTIMNALDIPCVFRYFLKIPCPGCGITRAALSVLKLDFISALKYNPFIFALPYVFIYIFFDLKPKKVHDRIIFCIGVLWAIYWVFNLVTTLLSALIAI